MIKNKSNIVTLSDQIQLFEIEKWAAQKGVDRFRIRLTSQSWAANMKRIGNVGDFFIS